MLPPARYVMYLIRDASIVVFSDSSILDAARVQELGDALYQLVDGRAYRKIILDFSKVHALSSSMLGVLVSMKKKADAIGGRIVLCGLRKDLLKVFTLTRLHKVFDIRANEEEALAVFGLTTAG